MGDLVDLAKYRLQKEEEAHQQELEEIDSLRAELSAYMDELGEAEPKMYVADCPDPEVYGGFPLDSEDDAVEAFHRRMIAMMMHTLDGYRHWPIDSSDM